MAAFFHEEQSLKHRWCNKLNNLSKWQTGESIKMEKRTYAQSSAVGNEGSRGHLSSGVNRSMVQISEVNTWIPLAAWVRWARHDNCKTSAAHKIQFLAEVLEMNIYHSLWSSLVVAQKVLMDTGHGFFCGCRLGVELIFIFVVSDGRNGVSPCD